MDYVVERRVQSDIKCVKKLVDEVLRNIKERIEPSVFFNTKLILYELMINGVIHGNCEDLNKMINIKIYINKSRIIIEVSDEGKGICYSQKSCGEFDFLESGRGLMLVEGLVDKFNVDGNTVTCVQYIK